ncbi:ABC transporter ATP-binding protein [Marinicrinis lubricantis]|uniref:ABC transporter ATP-binding protein n=1 Tax=Marinicrinis lubricantis TaxID=2086470 RepID=A0ABW1IK94_9BACL
MTKTSNSPGFGFANILKLMRYMTFPKMLFSFALILSLLNTGASLIVPLFTRNLVDKLSLDSLEPSVIYFLIGAFIVQAVSSGLSHYMLSYVGQRMVAGLRSRLWEKVLSLPLSYFDQNRSGEPVSRITQDTSVVMNLVTQHLISFFTNIISIIGAVSILFFLDWQMTLIIVIVTPFALLIVQPLGRRMYRISKKTQQEMASLTSDLNQVVSEIRLVKASNAETKEKSNGIHRIEELFRFGRKEATVQAVLAPFMTLIMMAVMVIIIGYGGYRVASGALSAGDLVAFILYVFQIVVPFSQFASFFTQLQKVHGASERLIEMMNMSEEVKQEGREIPHSADRSILFDHVRFAYNGEEEEGVLKDITFTIPERKVTAIVGPSGSGKTTIFSLLERFYSPQEGTILYGGRSIADFSLKAWREQIGYVSQESPLLAGTIRENITYGLERSVALEEVEEAARMANAHEFIAQLPRGYDTEVGERGMKLSGGQRQRIAIARAILRNPRILLLDEATSSLDSASEHEVQKALQALMENRTTVVIAHRLSTIVGADQIIVLEYGKVTGAGTHDQLFATHSLYRELARKQFQTSGSFT